jgi:hypothetical protein
LLITSNSNTNTNTNTNTKINTSLLLSTPKKSTMASTLYSVTTLV